MVLQAYIDDSKTGEEILVLAGYVADFRRWEKFSIQWGALLKEYPQWNEFKMKRAIGDKARAERFYRVVEENVAVYLSCAVEIAPLRRLCQELGLPSYFENPYNFAFKAIAGASFMELGRNGLKHPIEFIFDERGEGKAVRSAWEYLGVNMSEEARHLIHSNPRFEKSHRVSSITGSRNYSVAYAETLAQAQELG